MKKEIIGTKIRKFRQERNISQSALAKALGYSGKSVISHIEKGDADMPFDKILLFLKTYEIDANELFGIEPPKSKAEENNDLTKRIVVYIHGLKGSHLESKNFRYIKGYDIAGLDYKDGNPWELKDEIQNKFKELTEGYEEVVVIANSIGAFYAYEYLADFPIKKAFFIAPVASMYQIIYNLMEEYGITDEILEEYKIIELDNGQMLSWEFYNYLLSSEDHWKVPTHIIYGLDDEIIYPENIIEFAGEHNATLEVKKGVGHHFHTKKEKQYIEEWILKNI